VDAITLAETELLSAEEYRHLNEWGPDVFDTAHLGLSFRGKDHHFLLYDDGRLASHVGVLAHTVTADGHPLRVGGLGGVVTVPGFQRRGHAARLMRRAAEWFAARGDLDAGLLFCLPKMLSYYGRLGWTRTDARVVIDQPSGPIVSPLHVMLLPVRGALDDIRHLDLASLPW
jgi:GNAT superfamily N-acetyltransferase